MRGGLKGAEVWPLNEDVVVVEVVVVEEVDCEI